MQLHDKVQSACERTSHARLNAPSSYHATFLTSISSTRLMARAHGRLLTTLPHASWVLYLWKLKKRFGQYSNLPKKEGTTTKYIQGGREMLLLGREIFCWLTKISLRVWRSTRTWTQQRQKWEIYMQNSNSLSRSFGCMQNATERTEHSAAKTSK